MSCHRSGGKGRPCAGEGHDRDEGRRGTVAGWTRDGDGGRRGITLGRGGDASRRTLGCQGERRGDAVECGHGAVERKRSSVGSHLENGSVRVLERIQLLSH